MVVPEEDKKKKLGWSLSLRASPRKGFSKETEEVEEVTKGRRQLFVTKRSDSSLGKHQLRVENECSGESVAREVGSKVETLHNERRAKEKQKGQIVGIPVGGIDGDKATQERTSKGVKECVEKGRSSMGVTDKPNELVEGGSDLGLCTNNEPILAFAIGAGSNNRPGLRKVKRVERQKGDHGNKGGSEGGKIMRE